MRKHALAAIIAATALAPASRAQTPMQQMTPGTEYLQTLNDERGNPDHPIWKYIAGVVIGANVGAIMTSGKPVACVMHPLEDSETTANMILRYLIETDMVGKEAATLEIAAVAAFSWYYPCGQML